MNQSKNRISLIGTTSPLGSTLQNDGVNFSLFAPFADKVELLLFKNQNDTEPIIYSLSPTENKTFYYWHIFIPNLKKNQLYGYRVYGENDLEKGILFDSSKVLVDPYAKAIVGEKTRESAKKSGVDNLYNCLKSVVIDDNDFDWENDISPKQDLNSAIIYEMHLGGFTKHESAKIRNHKAGTFSALTEKISYLKELGITTIELLPVFAFDAEDAFNGKTNYWGYSPINFFAPHSAYATQKENPQAIVNEFKAMIKAFHKAGIEVILDVVYNHSTENKLDNEPTYSFRGIANNAYYMIDENGKYRNYSGTGNTINANHSVVRRMIIDSLRYWVQEMHVDGFRFDLASILARSEDGTPLLDPPVLWAIESDPVLAGVKLIAEPWDASGLYQVHNFRGDKWAVWNGDYRDILRRFLKGDAGQIPAFTEAILGSPSKMKSNYSKFIPERSIQFVTAHDGFTLNDLVSYNEKHNFDNGENNKDGHNDNLSWNCGIEGKTTDETILKLRHKQRKNLLSMLFLSHGTPMLLMGDEVGRTQNGNNNAYCQDNEIGWFNWDDLEKNADLFEFTKQLIRINREHSIFSSEEYLRREPHQTEAFVRFHGTKLNQPNFGYESRSIMVEYNCQKKQEHFFAIFNQYWEKLEFEIPKDKTFEVVFTTGYEALPKQITESVQVEERSVCLLKSLV